MIRSLRLRFFLIVWPLVVLALLAVALSFGRWTRVELERLDELAPPRSAVHAGALVDSIAAHMQDPALAAHVARLAEDAAADVVVTDAAGELLTSTSRDIVIDWIRGGMMSFTRQRTRAGFVEEVAGQIGGTRVHANGAELGWVYVIPRPPPLPDIPGLARDARRTIWQAVLLAALVSAAATLLLARPVVGQVRRLAETAARIRAGGLDARVRVSSDDELGELETSFNDMAESLQRAEESRRRMTSDVAHELRTPLTNILGSIEAVRDGLLPADAATLTSLHEEATLLRTLVEELQELSLAEAGAMRFDIETVDAAEEIERAVHACRAGAGDVRLRVIAPPQPLHARADRRRLAQVVRNLLSNAIRHSPADAGVDVTLQEDGDVVVVTVTDAGPGIPAGHLPLIWERFHRTDASRDRATGGMGLGLAVVRQLVQGMGGTVSAANRAEGGASFEVRLPRA